MTGKLLPMMLAFVIVVAAMQTKRGDSAVPQPIHPLEVLTPEFPQWKDGCLQLGIDRVNRSSDTLYLLASGLIVSSSGINSVPPSGHNPELIWFPVYGVSDILDFSAVPLVPGETKHFETCVGPTFAITNIKKETRREVPLQGQLRIDEYYFLNKQDALTYKSQHEEMFRTPPSDWPKVLQQPEVATLIMPIPCRESSCKPGCDEPPIVLDDEARMIPDVSPSEWNDRGKAIEESAQKLSPCPAP